MAGDSDDVRVWTGAAVYVAPIGSTGPTDVETELGQAWEAIGLLHEDGMTFTNESNATELYEYGGDLVKTVRNQFKRQITVTPLENSHRVFLLKNPGSTATDTAAVPGDPGTPGFTKRVVKTPKPEDVAMIVELSEGDIKARRVYKRVALAEVGEEQTVATDYPAETLTFNVYRDSNGVYYEEYTNDSAAKAGS